MGELRDTSSFSLPLNTSPACTAPGQAAGCKPAFSKILESPEMGPKDKRLLRTVSTHDLNMDTTSDSQRKRQFVDAEGFTFPSKTAKFGKEKSNQNSIVTSKRYEILTGETAVLGPSGVSRNVQSVRSQGLIECHPSQGLTKWI